MKNAFATEAPLFPCGGVERAAAERVLADRDLDDVLNRAREALKTGFNAGSTYAEIWIRDWASFMDLSCEVNDPAKIRDGLILILRFQRQDGNLPDGVYRVDKPPKVPGGEGRNGLATADVGWREVISHPEVPDYLGFKNSVETDQESSFVLAASAYLAHTGDRAFLDTEVEGLSVRERMVRAMDFLHRDRWSEKYGLIWGAATIDWGDIAPEDDPGAVLRKNSARAIDVYDNAMFVRALDALVPMLPPAEAERWKEVRDEVRANCRKWLWLPERQKFRNHIYLGKSPFPKDFDEEAIWYQGGTAEAILAGILNDDEARASLKMMRLNQEAAGGMTIGITNYPAYPEGLFANDHVLPGIYQNGGDWDWFGGRMVQALAARGMGADAYLALKPMIRRVQRHGGFFEWFDMQDRPQGSGAFRGAAGVLGKAILMLQEWARKETKPASKKPGRESGNQVRRLPERMDSVAKAAPAGERGLFARQPSTVIQSMNFECHI